MDDEVVRSWFDIVDSSCCDLGLVGIRLTIAQQMEHEFGVPFRCDCNAAGLPVTRVVYLHGNVNFRAFLLLSLDVKGSDQQKQKNTDYKATRGFHLNERIKKYT